MSKSEILKARFGASIAQTIRMPTPSPSSASPEPDRYAGAIKSRSFGELPLDSIVANPQPRTAFDADDLRRLADSIRRFGQLAPIRVRFQDEHWVVLVGERRFRACRLAGLATVRVEFIERDMTEADMLAEQVVENVVRADLSPVEQGRAYKRLLELNGWTAQALAETLGVEPTAVYRALALLRLPDDVAAQVDAGQIKATAGYELAKLQIAADAREVARKIVAEGLDHKATVREVQQRRRPGRQRGRGARRVIRTSAAKVTVELRRGASPDAVAVALREALGQVENAA